MNLTWLKTLLVLLTPCAACCGQADFRFYVFDKVKTEKLHYEFGRDITIYDFDSQKPRLSYSTEYRIYGIGQDEFTYTTESYAGDLSEEDSDAFIEKALKLPMRGLDPKRANNEDARSFGSLTLKGTDHSVTAIPDTGIRKQWQTLLDELLAKHAPVKRRELKRRTVEGDKVKPREIDFATLLKRPRKYDGKRIRITGFYHGEFERSSFAATKKDTENVKQALWLGGSSTFADAKRLRGRNDATLTVEGTFELGPGGHGGMWMGELVRLTESIPANTAPPRSCVRGPWVETHGHRPLSLTRQRVPPGPPGMRRKTDLLAACRVFSGL